jgi:hypothetical protein
MARRAEEEKNAAKWAKRSNKALPVSKQDLAAVAMREKPAKLEQLAATTLRMHCKGMECTDPTLQREKVDIKEVLGARNSEMCAKTFGLIDFDNSGFISIAELTFMLNKIQLTCSEEEVQRAFTGMDVDLDGQVGLADFTRWALPKKSQPKFVPNEVYDAFQNAEPYNARALQNIGRIISEHASLRTQIRVIEERANNAEAANASLTSEAETSKKSFDDKLEEQTRSGLDKDKRIAELETALAAEQKRVAHLEKDLTERWTAFFICYIHLALLL